ncbi:hypothetical protein BD413DRAFT_293645 [Trametes elegans]|nr:hypothetical protein BD413DRAFT_293645 [Trametes elegans]
MSSSHPPQYAYSLPPPMQDSVRLPSIKDLNFPPPGQDGGAPNGNGRAEHARPRHESTSWSRSSAPTGPPPPQHVQHPPHPSKTRRVVWPAATRTVPASAFCGGANAQWDECGVNACREWHGPLLQKVPFAGRCRRLAWAFSSRKPRFSREGRLRMMALTYCDWYRLSMCPTCSIWS